MDWKNQLDKKVEELKQEGRKMPATIVKVGVAWTRKFKNGKEGIKISINKQLYVAYKNLKKKGERDPDFIVVQFIDEPKQ